MTNKCWLRAMLLISILAASATVLAAVPGTVAAPPLPTVSSVGAPPALPPPARILHTGFPTLSSSGPAPSKGSNPPTGPSSGPNGPFVTLWEQVVSPTLNGTMTETVTDTTAYSSYSADDFTNSSPWSVNTIFVPGIGQSGFTSLANATSLTWAIYADASGVPAGYPGGGATPFWTLTLVPTDSQISFTTGTWGQPSNATLTLTTPVALPAGTWWLVFYPTMSIAGNGYYYWQASDTTNVTQAQFINPSGAFGYGTAWVPNTTLGLTQHDLAFRLGGQVCSSVPLWNQPESTVNSSAYESQAFDPGYAAYSAYMADDFTNASAWTIRSVYVPGEGWNGFTTLANATSLTWAIYADAGGFPAGYPGVGADPVWTLTLPPSDPQVVLTNGSLYGQPSNVTLTLNTPTSLPPGTWWLVFYPTLSLSAGYGQWGRTVADSTSLAQGLWINPGGGFGQGTSWLTTTAAFGITQYDLAFEIFGQVCNSTVTINSPALGGATCDWPVTHGTQTGRLTRNGVVSSCASPKTCPGLNDSTVRAYDAFSFSNSQCSDVCVTATLNTACTGSNYLFMVAYLGAFVPSNLCTNYLADIGSSPSGAPLSMTFTVPAGATFTLIVHEVTAGAGCAQGYILTVDGLPCPPRPDPPTSFAAGGTCTGVNLYWITAPGSWMNRIYRADSCGGTVSLTITGAMTSPFEDIWAVAGTTYTYWMEAYNDCGWSANSSCSTAARLSAAAVGDTENVTRSGGNIVIKWTDVVGATSYRVYQDTSPSGAFATLVGTATSGSIGLTFPIPTQNIFYKVAAVNGCGVGPTVAGGPDTEVWTPATQ